MELRRPRRAEEPVPHFGSKAEDAGQVSVQVTKPYAAKELG
jgi:hypothetical protein